MRQFFAGTLSILGIIVVWGAMASAADLPGTVQPGQIEKQFQPEPKIRAERPERIVTPAPDQPVPSNAKEIRFKLTRLAIEGATVYSEQDMLADHREKLDTEISLFDIYQIAAALTAKYRNDGYILSQVVVPAQSVEDGRVRLQVVEGYIDKLTLEGVDGDRRKLVQRYADRIRQSRPLRNDVLERYLLFMNDLPGAFARATIKPSPSIPGASDMHVQFTQQPVQGGLSLDNRGGRSLGPLRLNGDIGFNSVLGLQERTQVRFVHSLSNELMFGFLSHEETIGPDGGKLSLSASFSRSKPEDLAFIPLNLETSSQTAVLMYSYAVMRSRSQNLSLRGSFMLHEGETKIFSVKDTRDSLRALRLGATYDIADPWYGVNLLDIELSQGIYGLGSSDNNDLFLSRRTGRVDFTKATLYAARLQSLSTHWSILAAVNAQYAFTDLLSSELYSFGGEHFGRGYDPSELVGDHGIAMKLELRYTGTGAVPGSLNFSYTGYAFYDAGIVYQRTSGGLSDSDSAASTGLGLRVSVGRHVSAYAEMAKPLTRDVLTEGNRDLRVYAGVSVRF